jgi:hypothetical protein
MGVTFLCPHCKETRLAVFFRNPIDGGSPADATNLWTREGTTFEDLHLSPSIDASKVVEWTSEDGKVQRSKPHWHGFIHRGMIV